MKNEEKIIELLLEYISRTDKMEKEFKEEMLALRKELNELKKDSNELRKDSNELRKDHNELRKDHNELRKDSNELRRVFNQTNSRQEALMKEIFSLSKRVNTLEEGN